MGLKIIFCKVFFIFLVVEFGGDFFSGWLGVIVFIVIFVIWFLCIVFMVMYDVFVINIVDLFVVEFFDVCVGFVIMMLFSNNVWEILMIDV